VEGAGVEPEVDLGPEGDAPVPMILGHRLQVLEVLGPQPGDEQLVPLGRGRQLIPRVERPQTPTGG